MSVAVRDVIGAMAAVLHGEDLPVAFGPGGTARRRPRPPASSVGCSASTLRSCCAASR